MIPQKSFWGIITIYILLGLYIFINSFLSPIAGIAVEKHSSNNWMITTFEYPKLAEIHCIDQGNFITKINNKDIDEFKSLDYDNNIRTASSLTVKTGEGELRNILIKHRDLPYQFLTYSILPFAYFLIVLFLTCYIYLRKKRNILSLNILILLLLTVSLAYSSTALSTRLDRIGVIVNSTSMILSLVLLMHFLKSYYNYINIPWKYSINILFFYFLPILVIIISILEIPFYRLYSTHTIIILSLFCILSTIIVIVIGVSYWKYPKTQIKLLFWCIILPIFPFLFLFVLPKVFFNQYIMSSTTSSLFMLLIPFLFIMTQLTERLYDINYYISRFRYYLLNSLLLTILIIFGVYLFTSSSIERLTGLAVFIMLLLLLFFYIKEKLDYFYRKVLFTPHGNYIHLLYSTIDEIGNTVNTEELFRTISNIVRKQLELETVYIVKYNIEKNHITYQQDQENFLHKYPDISIFKDLQLREIKKFHKIYVACLHQNHEIKHFLILGNREYKLKNEELLWLELLILYVNNFIDNTKLIEDLLAELKAAQGNHHPSWLKKLVWLQLENEKQQLAQELHDTILQEQIFLIRQIDSIIHETDIENSKLKTIDIHQQLTELNCQLRVYCEKLKPPLLDTLGLDAALTKLLIQTKKRAHFSLIHSIEPIDTRNNQIHLLIYRIIQEMLNNALKHSQATYVKIQLTNYKKGFEINYIDNGVGCDIDMINNSESMGLTGMKERVFAFNGYINIETCQNVGMKIYIKFEDILND